MNNMRESRIERNRSKGRLRNRGNGDVRRKQPISKMTEKWRRKKQSRIERDTSTSASIGQNNIETGSDDRHSSA